MVREPSRPAPDWPDLTPEEEQVLRRVLAAIRQVRYGYVQIILQDGKVVQIDRLDKERLRLPGP